MKYRKELEQLKVNIALKQEIIQEKRLFEYDDPDITDITYYKLNDTEAWAVVSGDNGSIRDTVTSCETGQTFTVTAVYIDRYHNGYSGYSVIEIPDTVCCIYGAENKEVDVFPFKLNNANPNFVYDDDWLYSADGEDLIWGQWHEGFRNINSKLNGKVKTIHHIAPAHNNFNTITLNIPASVERICRIDGKFSDVTFGGKLPLFAENAFDKATFGMVRVLTPLSDSSQKSIKTLMNVQCEEDEIFSNHGRPEGKTLFAISPLTNVVPHSKGYIALTNAKFECDGKTILVNTPWIATIVPYRIIRSNGEVDGSVILIGLKEKTQVEGGVKYVVYESPEEIDEKIAKVQVNQ